MDYFYYFLYYLLQAYGISTILYLIISLFSGPFKGRRKYYLSIANTIAAVGGILMAVILAASLIMAYYEPEDIEHAFFYYRLFPLLITIILLSTISLFTLFRKREKYILFTLTLIFFLNTAHLAQLLYLLIADYFSGEFIKANWIVSTGENTLILYVLPLSALYFITVYIMAGKKQAKEVIT